MFSNANSFKAKIKNMAKDRGISKGIVYKEYHIGK